MAGSRNVKPTKEAFHVRVEAGDGSVAFYNATDYVGKVMPFKKPRATCAMRVSGEAVSFSLLHLTNKNAAQLANKPVVIPRGPLARLERRAVSYGPLDETTLIVELSTRAGGDEVERDVANAQTAPAPVEAVGDNPLADVFSVASIPGAEVADDGANTETASEQRGRTKRPMRPATIETFRCVIRRDEHGVAHVEAEGDEHIFDLPRGALHASLYLASPVASINRVLAIGFIGHVGKPGSTETVSRVAAMVLNSLTHLSDFRILSKIETCKVPANPARGASKPVAKRPDERVVFPVKVFLFDETMAPAANGEVICEIDLENANPTTGRLLVSYQAPEALGDFEPYRAVFDAAIAQHLRVALGDDTITEIVYDIVLGSVGAGAIEMLRDTVRAIPAYDVTTTQFRVHG